MPSTVTYEIYEISYPEETSGSQLYLSVDRLVTFSDFDLNSGDGWRPFSPLVVSIKSAGSTLPVMDDHVVTFPFEIDSGDYIITFLGETFDGVGLFIRGLDLFGITKINWGDAPDVIETDTTPFVRKDGTRAFEADESMSNHKLIEVEDPTNAQDAATKAYVDENIVTAIEAAIPDWFGDHSDGDVTFDGTQGTLAGVFTKDDSTHYTILREVHFGNVQINSGIYVRCAFRFFYDTLTCNGFLHNNGNDGTAGTDGMDSSTTASGLGGSKGVGGAAPGAGYFLDDSGAGMDGIDGENNDGSGSMVPFNGNAASPSSMSNILGSIGYQGASGGTRGSGSRGGGGGPATGGVASSINSIPASAGSLQNLINAYLGRLLGTTGVISFNLHGKNGGPASGGGGCSGAVYGAGYGAGGGGSAGNGSDAAPIAVIGRKRSGTGKIQSNGGHGKDGGKGGDGLKVSNFNSGNGGGGGGSNGGHGSVLIDICHDLTDWVGSVEVIGGAKGYGGQPGNYPGPDGASATAGGDGQDGRVGLVIAFKV